MNVIYALQTIARHAERCGLPDPLYVDASQWNVTVSVEHQHRDMWLNSVTVAHHDGVRIVDHDTIDGRVRHETYLVDIGDLRFALITQRNLAEVVGA